MEKSKTKCLVYIKRKKGTRFFKRVTVFLLLVGISNVLAGATYSQSTKFSFHRRDITLGQLFEEIQEQSEFKIFYKDNQIDLNKKINLAANEASVEEILDDALEGTHRDFKVFDRQIVIFPTIISHAESKEIEGINTDQAQRKEITGRVTDTDGIPIPGVSVVVKGTTIGTVTNANGEFSLRIPGGAEIIVFSFVGMRSQEVAVEDMTTFNVVMEASVTELEEVVAVGYGLQKKESVVGAISVVEGDDVRLSVQGGDFSTSLRGSAPGMISMISTGVPGGTDYSGTHFESAKILIRGKKTWNDSSPLVLVDGVERDILNVDPYAVEQISILKDASATAVFGVKGANGVILITTRRGEEGKPQISFDYTGTVKTISRISKEILPAGSYEAVKALNYAILNEVPVSEPSWNTIVPQDWVEHYKTKEYPYYFPDINWHDELLKDYTIDHRYNLTVSGGTKLVKYFSTVSFLEETDIINQSDIGQGWDPSFNFKRVNLRTNLDFDITPSTTFSVKLSGNYFTQRKSQGHDLAWNGLFSYAPESFPMKYSDGTWAFRVIPNMTNFVYNFAHAGYDTYKGTGVYTNFRLNQKLDLILKGLSVNARLAYDHNSRTTGPGVARNFPLTKYIQPYIVDDPAFTSALGEGALRELEEKYTIWNLAEADVSPGPDGYDWTLAPPRFTEERISFGQARRSILYEFRLNYQRTFGKHEVSGLALMSRQQRSRGSVFPSYREDWAGRITYDFDRRYLFEANAAYNGSEKFGREFRFGFFPSVAVGWRVSNESFFENLKPYFSTFKLRYSNGLVGSDAGIDRWLYVGSYIVNPQGSTRAKTWRFGSPYYIDSPYPFRYEGTIPNPDIHWETSHKIDYGIEAGFFNDQLLVNFDYFTENRTDIFLTGSERNVPAYYGADPVSANLGEVDVHGWELEGEYRKSSSSGVSYWLGLGWAFVKDKVIEKGDPLLKPDYQKAAGYSMDQPRSILNQGTYSSYNTWNDIYNSVGGRNNTYLLPGDWMRIDYNSDGVIDSDDAVPHGYPTRPQYTYAPSAGISYRDWSATVNFYGVYNLAGGLIGGKYGSNNFSIRQARIARMYIGPGGLAWSPEYGTVGKAKVKGTRMLTSPKQGYVHYPRTYFRLDAAQITYNLTSQKAPFINEIGISSILLSLTGNNLLLISDVYIDADRDADLPSAWRRKYPVLRRVSFGMKINL